MGKEAQKVQKVLVIPETLGQLIYNYLNTQPRGQVNDMCNAFDQAILTTMDKIALNNNEDINNNK